MNNALLPLWLNYRRQVAVGLAMILPWSIYNSTRFADPVPLSSDGGSTLLAGNCPPYTYRGILHNLNKMLRGLVLVRPAA